MKNIFTLLLLSCLTTFVWGKEHKTYQKLCEVNKCWAEQTDIGILPEYPEQSYRDWIKTHLQLVEQTLRARSTTHLSATQKANRLAALDDLHEYWQGGGFPINDITDYQTPIFIDKHDNFCAVGYLVKATGHEDVSRMIAAKTNLAYVRDMNYPELTAWATEYGFTKDELAWIQPGYLPINGLLPMGKGTDGTVHEMYTAKNGDKLYVGGTFTNVDGTIKANNIAYVEENDGKATWYNMGTGVDGSVYAVEEFDGKVFVAGSFSNAGGTTVNNVAYWDGMKWNAAGCITGTVKDLVVYKSELYAVGDFDVCAALSEVNLAKWNGTTWEQQPGIDGHINTAHATDNYLILGGQFSLSGTATNIIKWDATNGYVKFSDDIANEVMDIEMHKDEIYVACKVLIDSTELLKKWNETSGKWDAISYSSYLGPHSVATVKSFNTLCSDGDRLLVGGHFFLAQQWGMYNCAVIKAGKLDYSHAFGVDGSIEVFTVYNNNVFAGGSFDAAVTYGNPPDLNGIAMDTTHKKNSIVKHQLASVVFNIYPNPATTSEVTIENDFQANRLTVLNMNGQLVAEQKITTAAKQTVSLPELAQGLYMIELSNDDGVTATQRLLVE